MLWITAVFWGDCPGAGQEPMGGTTWGECQENSWWPSQPSFPHIADLTLCTLFTGWVPAPTIHAYVIASLCNSPCVLSKINSGGMQEYVLFKDRNIRIFSLLEDPEHKECLEEIMAIDWERIRKIKKIRMAKARFRCPVAYFLSIDLNLNKFKFFDLFVQVKY